MSPYSTGPVEPTDQALVDYISEAKKRGLSDLQIKKLLVEHNWKEDKVNRAIEAINSIQAFAPRFNANNHASTNHVSNNNQGSNSKNQVSNSKDQVSKNQVSLFLSNEMMQELDKRAKKNMMTVSELIEEILRKSSVSYKQGSSSSSEPENLDDPVSII